MQLQIKIALFFLINLFSPCYGESRFDISNKVKNGVVETASENIYDLEYIVPQDQLIGIDSNLFVINDIQGEWKNVLDRSKCSDEQFEKSFDYIKYLFFLSRVSLNYEILLSYRENLKNYNNKVCQINFNEVVRNCRPKSHDMKKFISRLKRYFQGFGKDEQEKALIAQLKSNIKIEDMSSPFSLASGELCEEKGLCDFHGVRYLSEMQVACDLRQQQFLLACHENDIKKLISQEMVNLIKRSTAIEYIKKFGATPMCVDRFFRDYVKQSPDDDVVIRSVMRSNVKLGIPYLQGRLSVIGSLKVFDELGVGSDIFQEIKIAKKRVVLPEVKRVKEIIKKPTAERKKIIKKVIAQKPVVKIFQRRKTALHLAELELKKSKVLKKVSLDMDHFKEDFTFTNELLTKLHKPLAYYQKRSSLKEMKDFDKLGEKSAPMRLLFLKYLIDNNYHQGLYNVLAILGEKFYVKNDLVKKDSKAYRMQIQNDESTNNRWQLYLFRD